MTENTEKLQIEYQAGKAAFERGHYRQAVQHLEAASALAVRNSRLGGTVQMWLVTAYEAAGQTTEAIALCKQLEHHPDLETRKQGKRLRYIMEAPQLTRRPEWLTEIPDLGALPEGEAKYRQGSSVTKTKSSSQKRPEPEPVDLSLVNTKDNRFIWVALIVICLILGSLVWWNFWSVR